MIIKHSSSARNCGVAAESSMEKEKFIWKNLKDYFKGFLQ